MRHDETGEILLSPREADVVCGVLEGKSNHDIGEGLGISTRTVSNYLHVLNRELGIRGKSDLCRWALQNPGSWRREPCRPGLHPSACDCGSPYCSEMRFASV